MSAGNGRAIRRRIAVIGALLTALSAPLVTATAARAVAPDIAVTIEPQIGDGYVGEVLLVPIRLVNLSPDTASAPMTVVVQVAGSTVNGLSTGAAICQPAPAGCVFTNGLAPGGEAFIGMQVTLVSTGTVTVTVSTPGDTNAANDTASTPLVLAVLPPTTVTLSAPAAPLEAHGQAGITAVVSVNGRRLARLPISLFRQDVGSATFEPAGIVPTDQLGVARWAVAPSISTLYKAAYVPVIGSAVAAGESRAVLIKVRYAVSASTSPVTVPPGSVATLTVNVGAGRPGTPVTVQRRFGKGPWLSIGHPKLAADRTVRLRITSLTNPGSYSFRAIRGADAAREQGVGEARIDVVTTGRGSAASWLPIGGTKARPARWNPCRPITYFVNPRHMPASGMTDLREALRRVTQASGLTFRYGGRENAVPTPRYRARRGAVLVAWASNAETGGLLDDDAVALAATVVERREILTGAIMINTNRANDPGFGAGSPLGLVLMHELGHVVGLDHVPDAASMMHPTADLPAAVWAAGDLAGLKAVGRGAGCL